MTSNNNFTSFISTSSVDSEGYQLEEYPSGENFPDAPGAGPRARKVTPADEGHSMFRSEEMALCQLFLQSESAYACVSELGELGLIEFRDLNPDTNAFQRKFVHEVRRCDEMERKLRFLEKEIKADGLPMSDPLSVPEAPQPREMIDLETAFEKLEKELQGVNQSSEQLKKNFLELTELKHILRKTQQFFDEPDNSDISGSGHQHLIPEESTQGMHLSFLSGVILRERIPAFERMLWRACRGNVFLRQAVIEEVMEDPNGGQVLKSVIVIFFQGDQLKLRVKKICEGFRATLYPCPDQAADRREMAVGVMQRLEDLNTVLGQTNDHRHRVLVTASKNIKLWFSKVRKIKGIYHTLNLFNLDVTQKCLIGEGWMPTADLEAIHFALRRGTEKSGSSVAPVLNQVVTKQTPPTFFRTNKYTSAFQELINAYGVASYQELNPAVYTIITFPFLFSVMFGDLGHGLIMMVFALWMCFKEQQLEAKKIDSEIWRIFFSGRYLMALMSFFSIYAGLIYNDVFSKSINIFGSSFYANDSLSTYMSEESAMLDPAKSSAYYGVPYPLGIDPVWQVAENKIVFLNAFKMKMSIILGVTHMLFGVVLSYKNHRFFQKPLDIITEFVPQVIFLSSLFGYLCLLMFHKWHAYYATDDESQVTNSEYCAPSILITFINMFLNKDNKSEKVCETGFMYPGQKGFQIFLVLIAILCVPVMLLAKPFILRKRYLERKSMRAYLNGGSNTNVTEGAAKEEEFDFGEILILQGIHTIEFVLGSVSHTASYLRLWALSLAHAQLSEVLWNMVLRNGLTVNDWYGGVVLWLVFSFWAGSTVAILCLMEGLSAFLHTLRLHWVEFQSKFYKGEGHLFMPFSFAIILKMAEEGE